MYKYQISSVVFVVMPPPIFVLTITDQTCLITKTLYKYPMYLLCW